MPLRVLVVEDDPSINKAICALLDDEGHLADCVETVAAATAQLQGKAYDVVLLDWMLRGETAEDLLPTLVSLPVVPSVVLYSAASDAVKVAEKWSIAFIKKPFDLDALLVMLARCADSRTSVPTLPAQAT